MSTHANMVKMTVSAVGTSPATGKGTLTLSAASAGYQSFATAYGANATVDVIITEGNTWEVCRNCTYTHSGTTLTRGTLESSSDPGNQVVFTTACVVSVVATAAFHNNVGLHELSASPTSAGVTGVVGTMHLLDISGLTGARAFTLPTAAATGDRIGVFCTTDAPTTAAYVLQIKSGASGDLINGTDHSTNIWSSLLIKGECLIFRCINGSTVDWIVEYDGRIPCVAKMQAASIQTGISSGAWTTITQGATGSWATPINIGAMIDATNHKIVTRRAGRYSFTIDGNLAALDDQREMLLGLQKNGTGNPLRCGRNVTSSAPAGGSPEVVGVIVVDAAANDNFVAQILHTHGSNRDSDWISGELQNAITAVEII